MVTSAYCLARNLNANRGSEVGSSGEGETYGSSSGDLEIFVRSRYFVGGQ